MLLGTDHIISGKDVIRLTTCLKLNTVSCGAVLQNNVQQRAAAFLARTMRGEKENHKLQQPRKLV